MQILDHLIELPSGQMVQEGAISVLDNNSPSYWFISRREFTIDMDRQSALIDFSNSTSRIDFRNQPAKEQVVIAAPIYKNQSGQFIPDSKHIGRFYSFLPTKDSYAYPWDINANFLVDEPRDHLRYPGQGTWNEALLRECGDAFLSLLDTVKKTWQCNDKLSISEYYNLMPYWDEASEHPQFSTHFKLIEESFKAHFHLEQRVPVFTSNGIRFNASEKCVFMDVRLKLLFPPKTWLQLLPKDKELVLFDLDQNIWQDFLCSEENAVGLYKASDLISVISNVISQAN